MYGVVVRFSQRDGFGYVRPRNGQRDILMNGHHVDRAVRVGNVVEFSTRYDSTRGRLEAVDVVKIF
jgi:cold shock CspA family protein